MKFCIEPYLKTLALFLFFFSFAYLSWNHAKLNFFKLHIRTISQDHSFYTILIKVAFLQMFQLYGIAFIKDVQQLMKAVQYCRKIKECWNIVNKQCVQNQSCSYHEVVAQNIKYNIILPPTPFLALHKQGCFDINVQGILLGSLSQV